MNNKNNQPNKVTYQSTPGSHEENANYRRAKAELHLEALAANRKVAEACLERNPTTRKNKTAGIHTKKAEEHLISLEKNLKAAEGHKSVVAAYSQSAQPSNPSWLHTWSSAAGTKNAGASGSNWLGEWPPGNRR